MSRRTTSAGAFILTAGGAGGTWHAAHTAASGFADHAVGACLATLDGSVTELEVLTPFTNIASSDLKLLTKGTGEIGVASTGVAVEKGTVGTECTLEGVSLWSDGAEWAGGALGLYGLWEGAFWEVARIHALEAAAAKGVAKVLGKQAGTDLDKVLGRTGDATRGTRMGVCVGRTR
eukprot:GFKZ01003628.1.p2 GENE.GFKZ01003628.1~~GFKZ01003628.1.p2  ORF type:complete len:176 (+),score=10.17 GFKZ01003628.1:1097-1624(+)